MFFYENLVIHIFLLHLSLQIKNTKDLVIFCILILPMISSPSLVESINFISNEIVTQTLLLETLCALDPAPASIIEAI